LASNRKLDDLDALMSSLQAADKINQLFLPDAKQFAQVRKALQIEVYGVKERNRIE
jgi:hypothetical protein